MFALQKFVKYQNNGDNGQKLTYFRNLEKPDQCPMRAILNIAFRALRLKVDTKGPLAAHTTGAKHNTVKYITNVNVEKHLREVAITSYDLIDKEDIQRYTCHFLRVGACVLLYAANSVPETIKSPVGSSCHGSQTQYGKIYNERKCRKTSKRDRGYHVRSHR